MADYKKVLLKNGLGEYVYPEIDPDDKGGGSGGSSRAFLFDIQDSFDNPVTPEDVSYTIHCYDLQKPIESRDVPFEEVTAEEYYKSFVPGGSVQILVTINGGDIRFSSNWSYGDETLDPVLYSNIAISAGTSITSEVVGAISDIEWHGIAKQDIGDVDSIVASPAKFYIWANYNGKDGSVTFNGYHLMYDNYSTNNSKPYSFDFVTWDGDDHLNLMLGTYNLTAQLLANTKRNIDSGTVFVDLFNTWYTCDSFFEDLFYYGNNTLCFTEDDSTQCHFTLTSISNDKNVATFTGIDCNKTLTLTLSHTDPANDPLGKNFSYPYISAYELKDNGGGGSGDNDFNWVNVPVYDSDIKENPFAKTRSYAILRVPLDSSSGSPLYTTVEELLYATHEQEINMMFGVREEGGAQVIGVSFSNEEIPRPQGMIYGIVDGGSAQVITASTPLADLGQAGARFYRKLEEE